jgi:hypothetical protein
MYRESTSKIGKLAKTCRYAPSTAKNPHDDMESEPDDEDTEEDGGNGKRIWG